MLVSDDGLEDLLACYSKSPEQSFKVSNYFKVYNELFRHLRGTKCTFIEVGVREGGSLFMWRNWLGSQARIIGIDLNPDAMKWAEHGFEIIIGDQGDPDFWRGAFEQIGDFDALLDDGGHQSLQQIVTVYEAIRAARKNCVVVVEDTCTSFMKEFSRHREFSFLEYAKDSTDNLIAPCSHFFPGELPSIDNLDSVNHFSALYSVQFFSGIVAFRIDSAAEIQPELVLNRPSKGKPSDYRYEGKNSACVEWPNPFQRKTVFVNGGKA